MNDTVKMSNCIGDITEETIGLIEMDEIKEWIIQNKDYLINYEKYINSNVLITNIKYHDKAKNDWLKKQYSEKREQLLENIKGRFSLASNQTRCPYCGVEYSTFELDHYFPRSKYSIYSVFTPNLVPICSCCNKKKLASNLIGETLYFHPYFHEINHRIFEYELLISNNQITFVDNKIRVSDQVDVFVKSHIEKLNLLEKWKHHFSNKLEDINLYIEELGIKSTKKQLLVEKKIELRKTGDFFPLVTFYEDVVECLNKYSGI